MTIEEKLTQLYIELGEEAKNPSPDKLLKISTSIVEIIEEDFSLLQDPIWEELYQKALGIATFLRTFKLSKQPGT